MASGDETGIKVAEFLKPGFFAANKELRSGTCSASGGGFAIVKRCLDACPEHQFLVPLMKSSAHECAGSGS